MAEGADDKSQDATPHRRQQAREEGQVAQSPDLASAGLLIVGLAILLMFGGQVANFFGLYAHEQLGGDPWISADQDFVVSHFLAVGIEVAKVLAPVLGLLLLAGVLVHVFQTGLLWVPDKLSLDLDRLNPLKGLQRIFSLSVLSAL